MHAHNKQYTFEKSRTGEIVPFLGTQPLHSMIDPIREAERLVSTIGDIGFVVFLGLGGGFAPQAALELTNAKIVVIDFDSDNINKLLSSKDYSKLINNKQFNLLIDPSADEIKSFILSNFKPVLYNGIKTIPLRTRIEQDTEIFEKTAAVIQEAIEIVSGDYSVQAHFGKKWFSNIIRNIKNADTGQEFFLAERLSHPLDEAAIVAAGPSLDHQIKSLAEAKSQGVFIISTDTAIGALLKNKIEPDVVISIDCQHISYYHFLGNKLHIPLILDIASPPMLYKLSPKSMFFSSTHPLALYACANWKQLPLLDTTGGNVTYACLSFAEIIGAKKITFFGADFSYVNSQSYARGTYIYPYFHIRQNRLSPAEAQFSAFLYRSPFLPKEENIKTNYYETSSLRFYRNKLEEKAKTMNSLLTSEKGHGALLNLPKTANNKNIMNKNIKITNNALVSSDEFLTQYMNDIISLPQAKDINYMDNLNDKQKQIFTTLLPYAASIKKRNTKLELHELIEEVKKRSVNEIKRVLK